MLRQAHFLLNYTQFFQKQIGPGICLDGCRTFRGLYSIGAVNLNEAVNSHKVVNSNERVNSIQAITLDLAFSPNAFSFV